MFGGRKPATGSSVSCPAAGSIDVNVQVTRPVPVSRPPSTVTLIYGNALIGLVPAFPAGCPAVPLPAWFDAPAIERRL